MKLLVTFIMIGVAVVTTWQYISFARKLLRKEKASQQKRLKKKERKNEKKLAHT